MDSELDSQRADSAISSRPNSLMLLTVLYTEHTL